MTLELRKFHLIETLIGLTDEVLLSRVEDLLREARIEAYEANLQPMSIEELERRALVAEKDIKNGDVVDMEALYQLDLD